MIIIGAGNLGRALANYANFEKRGFVLIGLFDKNPKLIGKKVRGIAVQSMKNLEEFAKDNKIDIATLAIPKAEAVKVAEKLAKCGVRAIWNFAHTDLNLPKNIVVENVHLSESLMQLSYNLTRTENDM